MALVLERHTVSHCITLADEGKEETCTRALLSSQDISEFAATNAELEMGEEEYADEGISLIAKTKRKHSDRWWIALLVVSNILTSLLSGQWTRLVQLSSNIHNDQEEFTLLRPGISNTQHTTTFTGLKYIPNNFSALPGGAIDVDAAWSSIGVSMDRFLVSPSEATSFPELTTNPTAMFLTPSSVLSGPSVPLPHARYPVFIETFHQLHCVNVMRQALYFNADHFRTRGEGIWASEERWIRNHVSHCMDYLRRLAMCHAETSLITFSWRNEGGEYMLNYEQTRQCGDFEGVLEWARGHGVDLNGGDLELRPPEGAEFKELKGS